MSPTESDSVSQTGEMSFLQHLEALRWHLVRSAIAVAVLSVAAFFFKEIIFDGIILAPKHPDFPTYRAMCKLGRFLHMEDDFCIGEIKFRLQNIDLSGQFTTHMMVSFISGLVLASPFIFWELWKFIKPALHDKERKYAGGIVFYTSALFLLGILFGYFVLSPFSVNFLATYQVSAEVENIISLDSFISTVTTLTLISGIVFELPVLVYFLTKLGLLTPKFMRDYRRHAVVVILILAAVITPSADITTMLLTAFPLYLLYEASIFVSHRVVNAKSKEAN